MVGRLASALAVLSTLATAACSVSIAAASGVDMLAVVEPPVATPVVVRSTPAAIAVPRPKDILPWSAAVMAKSDGPGAEDPKCSGSVVAAQWVLTAGHCQASASGSGVQVAVVTGRRDLTRTHVGQYLSVDKAVRMPGWLQQGIGYRNDFTLLHLSRPTTAPAVALAIPGMAAAFATGSLVRAAGWGALSPNGDPVRVVHSTTLERLPDSVCATEYGSVFDARTQLCGGWRWPSMDHDTCNGDSGGPLAMTINGRVVEVAATSWGSTCLTEGVPGVYADVAPASSWIASVVSAG